MGKYYKTELHSHTSPASICSDIDPKHLIQIYKENGYDGIVLTNHFYTDVDGKTPEYVVKHFLEDYYKCIEEGKKLNLNVILGAEIRFTENSNDYLIYGIDEADLSEIYKLLPYGNDNFYKEFKNEKNVILQAHPFRDGMQPKKISIGEDQKDKGQSR